MNIQINDPVQSVPLIGPKQGSYLENLNIFTVKDLLFHIPFRYKDTSEILKISELKEQRQGTILVEIISIKNNYTRIRKVITKAVVTDGDSKLNIIWYNQSYLAKAIIVGETYLFEGKMAKKGNDLSNPSYEKFSGSLESQTHIGKITPFYPETAGISSKWLRARLNYLKPQIPDLITEDLPILTREKYQLISLKEAISHIHFTEDFKQLEQARKRLSIDELLKIALNIERYRLQRDKSNSPNITINKKALDIFTKSLPYELTNDQRDCIERILEDMNSQKPMNRLLNGDVGSGKTIVAAVAAYNAILSGYSVIIMAPTTILAKQHFNSFEQFFPGGTQLVITGNKLKEQATPQIIIGTHALLFEKNLPKKIGLVIIDEQHRFGVNQRNKISQGAEILEKESILTPHYLTMTATPIPRTLTSIIYGGMEISLIKEMPKNRIPIKTYFTPSTKREDCYAWVKKQIKESNFTEQAFIIFPLIEESEKIDAKAAVSEFEILSRSVFKDMKCGLLHGQLKEEEKNSILLDFKEKKYHILFATSVIEVGIDIPDATMIIIESAERFGLAQLHQFRGRVGRGNKQSYCFVIANMKEDKKNVEKRLEYFSKHNSGFDVAEYDLESRGPGEVYSIKQTGIPSFKVANITDFESLSLAREIAKDLIHDKIDQQVEQYLFK